LFQAGAHGWGFTLAGKDDWKLEKFSHDAPTHNFKVDYGVDGTGTLLHIFTTKFSTFSLNLQKLQIYQL
jgi:hypothetical protein